jgi:hypothetical protein
MATKKDSKTTGKTPAAKAAPAPKQAAKLIKPKSYEGTQADWDATSAAGKVYHIRKAEGLCVRCGKKAAKGRLMCETHDAYIKSFKKGSGDEKPAGKSTGKAAKAAPKNKAAAPAGKGKGKKGYQQLGVKQLKDLNAEDQHMASIAEE